jgi:hypothetical protein
VVVFGPTRSPLSGLPKAQQSALRAHYAVTDVSSVRGLTIALLVRTK